jgi:DNA-binding transcriptional LysR family regulator
MSELHAFIAVARCGSFTRAADELCVTQAAISRAIGRLEMHFAQVLIKRSSHEMVLTPAGQAFLDAICGPVTAIEEASGALLAKGNRNRLTLSIVPTLASVWLVPRMPDFYRRHPEIELSFVPYRRDEDFTGPAPDAAILTGAAGQWPSAWICDYVIGSEMVPVSHPGRASARVADGHWRQPADLMREPLLYHTSAPASWQLWLKAAGVTNAAPKLASGFDHVSILIQAVIADMGVAVLQRCLVRDELAAGRLVAPFDLPITLPRGYYLCAPVQRRDHPALNAFRAWLLEMAVGERALGPAMGEARNNNAVL